MQVRCKEDSCAYPVIKSAIWTVLASHAVIAIRKAIIISTRHIILSECSQAD